jgi:hypothetical protein
MTESIDLAVIKSDDWDAVYVDEVLVYSGHEDLVREILFAVDGKHVASTFRRYVEEGTPAGDYLCEHGDYPPTFSALRALL